MKCAIRRQGENMELPLISAIAGGLAGVLMVAWMAVVAHGVINSD